MAAETTVCFTELKVLFTAGATWLAAWVNVLLTAADTCVAALEAPDATLVTAFCALLPTVTAIEFIAWTVDTAALFAASAALDMLSEAVAVTCFTVLAVLAAVIITLSTVEVAAAETFFFTSAAVLETALETIATLFCTVLLTLTAVDFAALTVETAALFTDAAAFDAAEEMEPHMLLLVLLLAELVVDAGL
ncbi:hypothetical protein PaeBR_02030 [Paenibacillus sp. BR2-3]|uniref:hypothetical protein n=1 Tax=Paenibacillus sp. BR2-3 TaxID=3048494 RepID=UPI0039777500